MNARYMLDTDICIYISKQRPSQVKVRFDRLKPGQVVMSVITYGELHYGASKSNNKDKALAELDRTVRGIPVEGLTPEVSESYGIVRAALEKKGRIIGSNDLWIAAHAMALGVTLATNNEREFLRVTGLSVENWTK